eukprot:TRINITY_DN3653_c0_g4_i1.p1 TRINITY_DN3653_c0_g4~~TRINITY_DN3653_c0_g4_i1.p1  ORF type:complete len:274 (-),score=73.40 TRINITY_DN3653_c0_g4_i1:362-1183(-)
MARFESERFADNFRMLFGIDANFFPNEFIDTIRQGQLRRAREDNLFLFETIEDLTVQNLSREVELEDIESQLVETRQELFDAATNNFQKGFTEGALLVDIAKAKSEGTRTQFDRIFIFNPSVFDLDPEERVLLATSRESLSRSQQKSVIDFVNAQREEGLKPLTTLTSAFNALAREGLDKRLVTPELSFIQFGNNVNKLREFFKEVRDTGAFGESVIPRITGINFSSSAFTARRRQERAKPISDSVIEELQPSPKRESTESTKSKSSRRRSNK